MSAGGAKERLSLEVVKKLYTEFLACAPTRANNYCVRALYASVFRSKLPHNDYSWLVDNRAAPPRARERADALLAPRVKSEVKAEPMDADAAFAQMNARAQSEAHAAAEFAANGGFTSTAPVLVKREPVAPGTQMLALDDMAAQMRASRTSGTVVEAHTNVSGEQALLTVSTCSYTGNTPVGNDTLGNLYGTDERREALRTIERTMSARFNSQAIFAAEHGRAKASVINDIAQTFLAHALEPFDISISIRFRRRIDEQLVVDNLVAMMRNVEYASGARQRPAYYDESVGEDGKRRFRDLFDGMHFNFFSRFPELAVQCDQHSPLPLIKALGSLWAVSGDVFCECALSQSGEDACDFMYNSAVDESIETRAPLLAAIAISYIEGIGYKRSFEAKQLMVLGIETAQLHIARLAGLVRRKPAPARYNLGTLMRGMEACREARDSIAAYNHSQYAFMRSTATQSDFGR